MNAETDPDNEQLPIAGGGQGKRESRFKFMAKVSPVLLWKAYAAAATDYFNKSWLNFSGDTEDLQLAHPWQQDIHPDDISRIQQIYQQALNEKQPYQVEYRIWCAEGYYGWVADSAKPVIMPDGSFGGYTGSILNITESVQLKEKLANEKRRLAVILAGTNVGTWEWNIQTGETIFNDRWAAMLGYVLQDISPLNIESRNKFTHPDDLKLSGTLLKKHFEGELEYYECEVRMKHRDGSWIWIMDKGKVHSYSETGQPLLMSGTHQDITRHKEQEQALILSEIRYRRLFESSKDGMLILDAETGLIKDANPFLLKMMGYSKKQLVDKEIWQIGFLKDIGANKDVFLKLQQKQYARYDDLPLKTEDGRQINVEFVSTIYLENSLKLIQCNIRDISGRKAAELARQQSLDRLKKIARMIPGLIYQYRLRPDGTSCFPYASEKTHEIFGVNPEDILLDASPVFNCIHPDDYAAVLLSIQESAKKLSVWQHEFRVRFDDGRIITVYGSSVPEKEQDGNLLWHGFIADITDMRKAQDKLLQLSHAVEQSPVSIVIANRLGDIEYVNKKFVTVTGYSVEESIGQNLRILKSGYTKQEEYRQLWKTLMNGDEWHGIFQNKKKNGDLYWESTSISPLLDTRSNITHFLALKEDITEIRKAQEKMIELNRDFVNFLNNTTDFIYFKDINSRIRFCSQTMANITGHSSWTDMIGKNDLEIFPKEFAQIYYEEELSIFLDGKPLLNRVDPYITAASTPGWISTSKWPLMDTEGNVVGLFGISRDITEVRKAAAILQEYTDNLKISNTDLENFAYIASHDLQEPLRMVSSFLKLLEKRMEGQLNESTQKYIDFAVDGADRMKQLINALLQYSRVGTNKDAFTSTDFNEVLLYITHVLNEEILKKQAVVTIQPMPVMMANKTLINELFLNLVNNALKYCNAEAPFVEVGYIAEKHQNVFYVKDNGIGISPEYFDKIFIIFKRLHGKEAYSGTGIGLALCKKIVETHKGKIWVESVLGKSSSFYFTIPK